MLWTLLASAELATPLRGFFPFEQPLLKTNLYRLGFLI